MLFLRNRKYLTASCSNESLSSSLSSTVNTLFHDEFCGTPVWCAPWQRLSFVEDVSKMLLLLRNHASCSWRKCDWILTRWTLSTWKRTDEARKRLFQGHLERTIEAESPGGLELAECAVDESTCLLNSQSSRILHLEVARVSARSLMGNASDGCKKPRTISPGAPGSSREKLRDVVPSTLPHRDGSPPRCRLLRALLARVAPRQRIFYTAAGMRPHNIYGWHIYGKDNAESCDVLLPHISSWQNISSFTASHLWSVTCDNRCDILLPFHSRISFEFATTRGVYHTRRPRPRSLSSARVNLPTV